MRGSGRRGLGLLLLAAAASCTQDFSSFRFVEKTPGYDVRDSSTQRDAAGGDEDAGASDRVDAMPSDAAQRPDAQVASDAGRADAGISVAGSSGASGEGPGSQSVEAGTGAGTGTGTRMEDDGGTSDMPSVTEQCTVSWPDLKTGSTVCRYCACNSCAAPIVQCLDVGDVTQRALCRGVLSCAVRTHCKDGACYCAGDDCGYPSASGDGPCVAEIEAAAGGTRARVTELRQLDPPPLDQPYLRAIAAITCLYGSDDASPGPAVPEQCMTSCAR